MICCLLHECVIPMCISQQNVTLHTFYSVSLWRVLCHHDGFFCFSLFLGVAPMRPKICIQNENLFTFIWYLYGCEHLDVISISFTITFFVFSFFHSVCMAHRRVMLFTLPNSVHVYREPEKRTKNVSISGQCVMCSVVFFYSCFVFSLNVCIHSLMNSKYLCPCISYSHSHTMCECAPIE